MDMVMVTIVTMAAMMPAVRAAEARTVGVKYDAYNVYWRRCTLKPAI